MKSAIVFQEMLEPNIFHVGKVLERYCKLVYSCVVWRFIQSERQLQLCLHISVARFLRHICFRLGTKPYPLMAMTCLIEKERPVFVILRKNMKQFTVEKPFGFLFKTSNYTLSKYFPNDPFCVGVGTLRSLNPAEARSSNFRRPTGS